MTEQESAQEVDAESDETTLHEEGDEQADDEKGEQKDEGKDGDGGSDPTDYQPTSDLPEPVVEPAAPPPGGPDAIVGVGGAAGNGPSLPADPDPEKNPETDNELPAETTEPDDTDTEATKGDDGTEPEEESPA